MTDDETNIYGSGEINIDTKITKIASSRKDPWFRGDQYRYQNHQDCIIQEMTMV